MSESQVGVRNTPLHEKHLELKAKMVDFAGFRMPVMYNSINAEHLLVRSQVGLFDLSHMGEFMVTGRDAESFLQRMTVNDVSSLCEWQIQYTCMCYPDGGIVDDLLVYRLPEGYMLVVNASRIDRDLAWIGQNVSGDVRVENRSDQTGLIAIQGPMAQRVLSKLTDYDLESMPCYWAGEAEIAGMMVLFSRTGYTGEDGFEIYLPPELCVKVWDELTSAGEECGIGPVGLGARDSLRLEMKYMLYGNDIDETTNPIQAGLSWIVKIDKGDFIGCRPIRQMKESKPESRLVAFEMTDRAIPRIGYLIFAGDEQVGRVTSGGYSPSLERGIGLGYVRRDHSGIGTEFSVSIRGKNLPATVIKPPFYKYGSRR